MNFNDDGNRTNAPITGEFEEDSSFDLRRYISVFLHRWKLFLPVSAACFLALYFIYNQQVYSPKYKATFDLGIAKEQQVDGYLSQLQLQKTNSFPNSSSAQRVISNLLSVTIARKIVDTLSLFISDRAIFSDFQVATRIRQDFEAPIGPCLLRSGKIGYTVSNQTTGKTLTASFGDYVDLGPFDLKISPLSSPAVEKSFSVTFYSPERTAFALRNSLSLKILGADKIEKSVGTTGIPYSGESAVQNFINDKTMQSGLSSLGILRINVFWGNPGDALKIAQSLSDFIIRDDINEKSVQFVQSRGFIEKQLVLYKDKLTQLEDNTTHYKKLKKIVNLTASTQARIMQISTIESRISQLEIEETVLENLSKYLKNDSTALTQTDTSCHFAPTLIASPVFQGLYSELLRCDADLKSKLREYSPGHPKVLETKARLDGLQDQLMAEAAKRLITIKTEIGSVRSENRSLQEKLENVPADEIQLARLERDRKITEQLYTFFREKLEDIRVREAGVTTDLKILNPAIVSAGPVNPPKRLARFLMALCLALVLGFAVIFTMEYFDSSIRYLDPVKNRLRLPLFAAIPVFAGHEKRFPFLKNAPSVKQGLNPVTDIGSPEFEAFRKLAFNLEIALPSKKHRALLITSACPGDGKTFISLNLGSVLGRIGKKVLLIDTDFRKVNGSLSEITALNKNPGVFDCLDGKTRLQEAIFKVPDYQFDLMPIGTIPSNPFILLESERMKDFFTTLKTDYDFVLIDGLPVLLFADAPYLAISCDGVLINCRYGRTSYKEIEDAQAVLSVPNINLVGLVLNSVPLTQNSYYYHHYYKYYKNYRKKAA